MPERIRPQDITPTTQSPFMTRHAARVGTPLAELLAFDELFLSVRNNLRPGDSVDLCRYSSGDWTSARILEFVTVLITQKGPNAVEFRQISPIFEIDAPKPELAPEPVKPQLPVLEVVPAEEGGFLVRDIDTGHVHKHFPTKAGATRYVTDYGRKAAA